MGDGDDGGLSRHATVGTGEQRHHARTSSRGRVMKRALKPLSTGKKSQRISADNMQVILRHWREAVPNDRLAHLVKDATRALLRALQLRLTHGSEFIRQCALLRNLW